MKTEFGLVTFADVGHGDDLPKLTHERIQNLLEEFRFADENGLDVFGLGEHHRPDYSVSSPVTVLAAAAAQTKTIKLSSAVTVLSSEDPVRVFQQFATVDQISGGRAEIMVGRGSFIESFPLFGYNLQDYNELFDEKLNMLLRLNESEYITWTGTLTQSLSNAGIYPRPFQEKIPIWQAIGGTPQSAVRAGTLGLPLTLAIIGGYPAQFTRLMDLYRQTWNAQNHEALFQLGINGHMYIAETKEKAAEEYFPHYATVMSRIGRERGWSPLTRGSFEAMTEPEASLLVGSPQEVADKIIYWHNLFGFTRFLGHISMGTLPHNLVMKSMKLYTEQVVPRVKEAIGEKVS